MKKIIEKLKQKWAEYFLEMIVIILGILVAFTLNNWNDLRKERIKEIELLVELRDNLTEDINVNKKTIERQNIRIGNITKAITQLESKMPNPDSLLFYLKDITYLERYHINKSAYKHSRFLGLKKYLLDN